MQGKKIILAVSGSIAAYKSVFLLRLLKKAGATVKVVTTPAVSHFVGELTFSSLSGEKVFSNLWEENWSEHVSLGTWADLMIVAPATANTLAKMAQGLCDNALTAVYLAARCPVVVAPAMDADMYMHPQVQANLNTLQQHQVTVMEVGTGFLASGLEGPGRMAEPEEIFEQAASLLTPSLLEGKRIMISAGPTREEIDPVRYITNHSTGKMGYALAQQAQRMGAKVTLVSGPSCLPIPWDVTCIPCTSTQEMYEAITQIAEQQDILIMAAAVSDYTPAQVASQKIKKSEDILTLELKKTTDILKHLGTIKRPDQLLVGFALETENELENAKKKLIKKNLDLIVLNSTRDKGAGFGHDTNKITLIEATGNHETYSLKAKNSVAKDILNKIVQLLES